MTDIPTRPPATPSHTRRRRILVAVAGIVATLAVALGLLVVARYLPALDDARALRTDLETMAVRALDAGVDIDRPTADALDADLAAARTRMDGLADLLAHDPLIGLARWFAPTQADVHGADALASAGSALLDGADAGLAIADRFVAIKAEQASDDRSSTLGRLVELLATSRPDGLAAKAAVDRARDALGGVPDGPGGSLARVREALRSRIDDYGPLLDAYVAASDRLPAILGWDGPRRYLVLTQNPAELRPTGGYTGSFGIVGFDRGEVTERHFQDVALLDLPWDYPTITPPRELTDYLLGPDQPWQLADANWSPDFPTSARDALRLYHNEYGPDDLDGVIAITTYTIDTLLEVTGPIEIPEYDTTLTAGETTLKAIQLTRVGRPGENRKAFLSTFADHLFERLLSLPADRWADLAERADRFRDERLVLAWFRDPAAQSLAIDGGLDGAVRQDPGDYVYPVEANVAPASKLHAITDRRLRLDVEIDLVGDVHHALELSWDNPIETEVGRPYREVPTLERSRILGTFFRLLAPGGSRIGAVAGGTLVPLTAPALVGVEADRAVFGNYLMIPPGTTTLRYDWVTPDLVEIADDGHRYRLTIQRQPGLRPGPLDLRISVPAGFAIDQASEPLLVAGDTAYATVSFDADLELEIRFVTAGQTPSGPG